VVECLLEYFERTNSFRNSDQSKDLLLRTIIKPHKGVTVNTVANWIKDVMSLAGIDTTIFKAHSTRSATTSKAIRSGISIDNVLMVADWKHAGTFVKFYCPSTDDNNSFSRTILNLGQYRSALNLQCYIL
jgi:site-specific recombinase XerD